MYDLNVYELFDFIVASNENIMDLHEGEIEMTQLILDILLCILVINQIQLQVIDMVTIKQHE